MCQRGVNARVDKGFNVAAGGAAGMILYNTVNQDVETDNHWLPAIHVNGPNTDLLDFVNTHTNVMATFAQGVATPTQADVMAAFSSRGPLGDWIKPDVTAPGIQVLAGMTPQPTGTVNGPPGNLYQAIAGTSMSSPHAAGVSALVKAAHPWWTPAMIKSALMTSAVGDVVKEDGVTPATPFDDGAGSIRANRAVKPTLVFDENYADFVAAGTDPLHRIDLNLASINATTMAGEITTKRVAINVSHRTQILHVETVGSGRVEDHRLRPQAGQERPRQGRQVPRRLEVEAAGVLGHDQCPEAGTGPVLRRDHARPAGMAHERREHAGCLGQEAGSCDAHAHVRTAVLQEEDGQVALHRERGELLQVAGQHERRDHG